MAWLSAHLLAGLALAACLTHMAPGQAMAEARRVMLACNDFPPLKIEKPGADGLRGSDVDVIAEIARRTGLDLETQFMPWNRGYAEASAGKIDGLCSCSYREDRAALFHFSRPIGQTSVGVFMRAGMMTAPIAGLGDLRGTRIGAVKGYNLEAELTEAGMPHETVGNDRQAYEMLVNARFDFLYSFRAPIDFMLRDTNADKITYREFRTSPYFLCLSKAVPDTAAMLPRIDAAIAEMETDGTFDIIQRRYGLTPIN
jgi:polar amino acid transport system substrate-binding protein